MWAVARILGRLGWVRGGCPLFSGFFVCLLYLEIIIDSQKAAKLIQGSAVYPSPTQLPSPSYVTILHYQNQEIDIGTVQPTRPIQMTRLQTLFRFNQFAMHSFVHLCVLAFSHSSVLLNCITSIVVIPHLPDFLLS